MHKSNSSLDSLGTSFLEQAYERTWQRLVAAAQETASDSRLADIGAAVRPVEPLLSGTELRRFLRKPLAWLFALAQGLAVHDPLDLAAVQHVGAATYARLSGRAAGFRATDMLSVFGLLLEAFNPELALRALSVTLGDDIAAEVLGSQLPVSVHVTTIPHLGIPGFPRVCPHPHCPMTEEFGR